MTKQPKALIIRAAGTNCDNETKYACQKAGIEGTILYVGRLLETPLILHNYHLFIIPGGFTYGDDLGAGKILANELRFILYDQLNKFISDGKLILGICNGFQVLVKAGLLNYPDKTTSKMDEQSITITFNDSCRFEDRWVYLKVCSQKSEFIRVEEVFELPIAHGEGKFFVSNKGVLNGLERNEQIILKYVNSRGEEDGYPFNPNGSMGSIAGVSDQTGRILGLMPHPERYVDPLQHPHWNRKVNNGIKLEDIKPDGLKLFENATKYIKNKLL